ncbi:MAG: DUF808 family protein, partial [Thermomonas sp.]
EGVEKLAHALLHARDEAGHHAALAQAVADAGVDLVAFERDKIRGAIRTDFVLSAEIIVIALGTVAGKPPAVQVGVLVAVALAMTVGVYGLVGAIVKLDDVGLHLARPGGGRARVALGRGILAFAPRLLKALSVAGTAAMFLVGGGILVHGIGPLHHALQGLATVPPGWLWTALANAAFGVVAGAALLAAVALLARLRGPRAPAGG